MIANSVHDLKWPNDPDGDVLRKLRSKGFDFSKKYIIDFSVDFESWPPSKEAIEALKVLYPALELIDEADGSGYILIKEEAYLSYELVVQIQRKLTNMLRPFSGYCDSWGVLH